jgi:hypothetical protein
MAEAETYKGRRISITEKHGKKALAIDGESVEINEEEDGTFSTPHNRFMTYRSPHDLARDLINRGVGVTEAPGKDPPQ